MRWLLAGAGLLGAIWIYRSIGWIRLEPTIAEQRIQFMASKDEDVMPRRGHRRTQPRQWWKLTLRRQTTKRRTA